MKAASKLPVVHVRLGKLGGYRAPQSAVHVPPLATLTPSVHLGLAAWPSLDAPSSLQ